MTRFERAVRAGAAALVFCGALVVASSGAPAASAADETSACTLWASPSGSDSNPGTSAAPVQSMAKVASLLAANVVACLRSGTYNLPGAATAKALNFTKGGTLDARAVVRTAPGEAAKAKVQGRVIIKAPNLTFTDLELHDDSSGEASGQTIVASNVTISNSLISAPKKICVAVGSVDEGIKASKVAITSNVITDCGDGRENEGAVRTNLEHGIYIEHAEATEVTDNLITNSQARGIQVFPDGDGSKITNNVIDGGRDGINIGGTTTLLKSENNAISENLFTDQTRDPLQGNFGATGITAGETNGNSFTDNCFYSTKARSEGPYATVKASYDEYRAKSDRGFSFAASNLWADPLYKDRTQGRSGYLLQGASPCAGRGLLTGTATVPGAPTGVSAVAGNASATVSWTAPSNGGSAISGYTVTPYIGASAQAAKAVTAPATSTVVTGLTNGTSYTFRVTATNGVGTGAASSASAAVTPTGSIGTGNDAFANRIALTPAAGGATSGSNTSATEEPGEPDHAGKPGNNSVWWKWTAPASGTLSLSTGGSNFDTLLALYSGSTVGGLTAVAGNDDVESGVVTSAIDGASVTAGTTYAIAVDGYQGVTGSIQLAWTFNGAPLDTTAPSVALTAPASRWNLSTSVPVTWSGSDASGIAGFDVRRSSGAWNGSLGSSTNWLTATTGTSSSFTGSTGSTYCLGARATDTVGNTSAWTATRCTAIPLTSGQLTYSSTKWTRVVNTADYGDVERRTTTKGEYFTRTGVVAKRVALVATICSTCGSVTVYWNGVAKRSVSLVSTATNRKKVIELFTFASPTSGTVKVVVTSATGKKVIIEGLGVSKSGS